MNDPRAELKALRALVNELLEEERGLNERIGLAVSNGELHLQWRDRRAQVRAALEDCYAALPHLEQRSRELTPIG